MMREEIKSLQKRLEIPTAQSIEWRVAYEEAKAELKKATESQNHFDNEEAQRKNEELEATIERLCAEKLDLEESVAEMVQSSGETRSEIDSMIHEVDRLEKDMHSLKNELDIEKERSKDYQRLSDEAHSKVENMHTEVDRVNGEKSSLESEMNLLKTKLSSLEEKVDELNIVLKQKQSEILELETLSRENELELQCTIEELERKLAESKSDENAHMEAESQLQTQLKDSTSLNEQLNKDLQEAMDQVKDHQSTISSLEEKIVNLTNEKDNVISTVGKYEESEVELKGKVKSLCSEVEQIQEERKNLQQRLSCVKEQASLTEMDLSQKTDLVHNLQTQIIELKDNHAQELKSSRDEKHTLDLKLSESKATQKLVDVLKSDLETREKKIDEIENKLKESNKFLRAGEEAREKLERLLEETKATAEKTNIKLIETEKSLAQNEANLKRLNDEKDLFAKDTIRGFEDSQKNLEKEIGKLEAERSKYLTQTEDLSKRLQQKELELDTMTKDLKSREDQISQLHGQNELLEQEKTKLFGELSSNLMNLKEQLNTTVSSKREIDEALEKSKDILNQKENVIKKLVAEKDAARSSLKDARSSLGSLGESHRKQVEMMLNEKQELQREITESKKSLQNSSNLQQELERRISQLEMKLDGNGKIAHEKIEELENQLKEKELSIRKKIEEFDACIKEKDIELSDMEKNAISMKSEYTQLKKKHNVLVASEEDTKKKILTHRDRVFLLERQRKHLESEIDNLHEDQNSLNNQVRALAKQNKAILLENENLKRLVESLKSQNKFSDAVSRGSTFENDSNLSYDNLSSDMDYMLGKISTANPSDEESEPQDPDESFDECMFLPNTVTSSNGDESEANDPVVEEKKENTNVSFLVVDGKENSDSNVLSTPAKLDYGVKRQPLSERKPKRTPLSIRSMNKLKSSTKKMMSSTKKSRSNYMMFNNKKLFSDK